jgi:hypothetical protein
MRVKGFRPVDDHGQKLIVELFETRFGKASADVADGLVLVSVGVIGGKKEGPVDRGSFTTAVVCTKDNEVEGVADSSEIVFLDL